MVFDYLHCVYIRNWNEDIPKHLMYCEKTSLLNQLFVYYGESHVNIYDSPFVLFVTDKNKGKSRLTLTFCK